MISALATRKIYVCQISEVYEEIQMFDLIW